MDAETIAHLLTYDSVHGRLAAEVRVTDGAIIVNGRTVAITSIKDPSVLPWRDTGVDIVTECTGLFRDVESTSKHLEAGARKVIISAPAKNPDITRNNFV